MNDVLRPTKDDPLLIVVGIQNDGAAYQLHPGSRARLLEAFPGLEPLRSVFLGHRKPEDFPRWHAPRWEQMAELLTGLTAKQLMRLGGVRIYAPEEERIVWEWLPAAATPR